MGCEVVKDNGHNFIMCSRGGKSASSGPCKFCGKAGYRLCDFIVDETAGKTCDVLMCDYCTHNAGKNKDLCPKHRTGAHTPRKDANAPRWMKALWSGRCRQCNGAVHSGDRMLWFKKGRYLFCEKCGEEFKKQCQIA